LILRGLVLPYDVVGAHRNGPRVMFRRGSLARPSSRLPLLVDHNWSVRIGRMIEVDDRPDGMYAAFALDHSRAARRVGGLVSAGRRYALSVGTEILDEYADEQDVLVITSARWRETSVTTFPVFSQTWANLDVPLGEGE
jgi:HK97 family phage prohead protease